MKLYHPFISVLVYGSGALRDQVAKMLIDHDSLLSKMEKLEADKFVDNAIGDFAARYQNLGLTIGPSPRDQQPVGVSPSGLQIVDSNVNNVKENYGHDSFLTRLEEVYVEDTPRRYTNYVIAGGGVSLVSLSLLVCMRTRLKANKRAQVLPISASDSVWPPTRVTHKGN